MHRQPPPPRVRAIRPRYAAVVGALGDGAPRPTSATPARGARGKASARVRRRHLPGTSRLLGPTRGPMRLAAGSIEGTRTLDCNDSQADQRTAPTRKSGSIQANSMPEEFVTGAPQHSFVAPIPTYLQ